MPADLNIDSLKAELHSQAGDAPAVMEPDDGVLEHDPIAEMDDQPEQEGQPTPQAKGDDLPDLPSGDDEPEAVAEQPEESPAETPVTASTLASDLAAAGFPVPPGENPVEYLKQVRQYISHLQSQNQVEPTKPEPPAAEQEKPFDHDQWLNEKYGVAKLSDSAQSLIDNGDVEQLSDGRYVAAEGKDYVQQTREFRELNSHALNSRRVTALRSVRDDLKEWIDHQISHGVETRLGQFREQLASASQPTPEQVAQAFVTDHPYLVVNGEINGQFMEKFHDPRTAGLSVQDRLELALERSGLKPPQQNTSPPEKQPTFDRDAKKRQYAKGARRGTPQHYDVSHPGDLDTLLHREVRTRSQAN